MPLSTTVCEEKKNGDDDDKLHSSCRDGMQGFKNSK
jgi:hypothetical protein